MKIKLFCKLAVLCFFFTVLAAKKMKLLPINFPANVRAGGMRLLEYCLGSSSISDCIKTQKRTQNLPPNLCNIPPFFMSLIFVGFFPFSCEIK